MIEVKGLTHRYGPLVAVEDLSFAVKRGEIVGLLGPNGAGKTTTMRAIVGLLAPSEGSITVGGHDLRSHAVQAREQLGYLPEHVPLYRDLTVREFLSFAAQAKGVPRAKVRAEVDRVVEACGLESVFGRLIGFCSRGFRQRIGLAQALAGDPPALILDEPTVGLDPAQVVEIRERVADLARDKAVILSTHILPEASLLCSRVVILNRGRCLVQDTPGELAGTTGPTSLRVACGGQAELVRVALSGVNGCTGAELVEESEDRSVWVVRLESRRVTPLVVSALVAAGCPVEEVRSERLGLEEVFLELVREDPAVKT